jgi:two-component system chemotaxis response regulator CheB
MVVDDSAVMRSAITRILLGEKDMKVVASAANGQLAIDALKRQPTDVVILDIEMPVLDGLSAIPLLKAIDPGVQIIMASTLTHKNADISLRALSLGATDYIPKPSSDQGNMLMAEQFTHELVEKVRTLARRARSKNVRMPSSLQAVAAKPANTIADVKKIVLRTGVLTRPDVIAIGSSTGGPQALFEVIKNLGTGLRQPIVITQHMPPSFTTILAEHIMRQCGVSCAEAKEGEILKPGQYYVAPGDFHLLFVRKPEGVAVKLTKDPAENYCRPSVDPMLRSLVEAYGRNILAVILTGMGQDGMKGGKIVVDAGGGVIAQDEATSVVWGMPGAVANAGLCSSVLPVGDIGATVKQIAMKV